MAQARFLMPIDGDGLSRTPPLPDRHRPKVRVGVWLPSVNHFFCEFYLAEAPREPAGRPASGLGRRLHALIQGHLTTARVNLGRTHKALTYARIQQANQFPIDLSCILPLRAY